MVPHEKSAPAHPLTCCENVTCHHGADNTNHPHGFAGNIIILQSIGFMHWAVPGKMVNMNAANYASEGTLNLC